MSISTSSDPIKIEKVLVSKEIAAFGERQMVETEKEIYYFRECDGEVVATHGGKIVKIFGTYNEFYGPFSSLNRDKEIKQFMEYFQVTKDSSMSIEVLATLKEILVYETEVDRQWNTTKPDDYKRKYTEVPADWMVKSENGEMVRLIDQTKVLANQETVYSSAKTPEENERTVDAFVQKWSAPAKSHTMTAA